MPSWSTSAVTTIEYNSYCINKSITYDGSLYYESKHLPPRHDKRSYHRIMYFTIINRNVPATGAAVALAIAPLILKGSVVADMVQAIVK